LFRSIISTFANSFVKIACISLKYQELYGISHAAVHPAPAKKDSMPHKDRISPTGSKPPVQMVENFQKEVRCTNLAVILD
jgi:hypothetical protein